MPVTEPGPWRGRLGFAPAVHDAFGFLESEAGLRPGRADATFVRYEGARRFVNVFHGRASYALGVEVGRWIDVEGSRVEQAFPLDTAIAVSRPSGVEGFTTFTAVTASSVARFLPQLATWTRDIIVPIVVADDDVAFELMSETSARMSDQYLQEARAATLRRHARSAWSDKDFAGVAIAYREILGDLPLVPLKPSERERLRIAEKRLVD